MSDDKVFDYVLARSRTRESSTLTIATVAASASLVLIALYVQAMIDSLNSFDGTMAFDNSRYEIALMGISFSSMGIAYREITKYTIHANDERWLHEYSKKFRNRCPILYDDEGLIRDPMQYTNGNIRREITLRSLFVTPMIFWFFILDGYALGGVLTAVLVGLYVIWLSKCQKSINITQL